MYINELAKEFEWDPSNPGDSNILNLNDEEINLNKCKELLNKTNKKVKQIGKIGRYILYREKKSNEFHDHYIFNNEIKVYFAYEINLNRMIEKFIWHKKDEPDNILKAIYIAYYIRRCNFDAIISDKNLSKPAFDSWMELIKYALNYNYKTFLANDRFKRIIPLTKETYEDLMKNNYIPITANNPDKIDYSTYKNPNKRKVEFKEVDPSKTRFLIVP